MQNEAMSFDVLIVGAGPSGLAAAIRLMKTTQEMGKSLSVCVLEKGAEVGAHIVSGCVLDPKVLDIVWPDWRVSDSPVKTQAKRDAFYMLSASKAWRLPTPPQMRNRGNYLVSLSKVCRWLAQEAERLGVMIIPGYAASEAIYDDQNTTLGVKTGDMGRLADGSKGPNFQEGVSIYARHTLLAEGCRGSVTESVIKRYDLRKYCQMQTYAIGVKEVWRLHPDAFEKGLVMHTLGWPYASEVYGGSFMYHYDDHMCSVGLVMGLDYANPSLDAHAELQRFKHHPHIRRYFQDAKRVGYAARALNEGGYQAIPTCHFPGGMIIGCAAGFVNVAKIKGTHTAMMSGVLAADAVVACIKNDQLQMAGSNYQKRLRASWVFAELKACRNIRPGFYNGIVWGLCNAAWETITFGWSPWTLRLRTDHDALKPLAKQTPVVYPKPDGILSFAKLDSVRLTNTNHAEPQPCHLRLRDSTVPMRINKPVYGGPEAYYCPAQVYEYVQAGSEMRLQINSQNCIHCKTCDIKDPTQNIEWVVPQGGDGPRHSDT